MSWRSALRTSIFGSYFFGIGALSLAIGIGNPERKYSRVGPGMFEPFDQLPHGPIQGSRHSGLLSPFHNRAVHEVDLGLPFGQHVLQHAGVVLARSACPPFHQLARVAVKFDSQSPGHSFPFRDEVVEKRSEEHTSELQSLTNLVCRLLLEEKNRQRAGCVWCSC